ncbi:MAG: SusC/RagA family TonB-linked outer membrane protein, partial [Dysgonamonadaceae bacterium]|nr:SusC/RagA family TonB-linked outer membrane protein [Dysgonamonadaceae bacterium]
MKVKKVILCLMFLLGGSCLFAQNKIIVSGLVSDKTTKEPLIGITVTDKSDKSVGTVTDVDGNYTLSVSENATLVFSYIGYQTVEIPVKGRKLIDVQMNEDTKELETVVVVGALMKKSDLTGAAVRITAADLKEIPTSDLNKAMQGKVPGVYIESDPKPGASAKIRVRGNNSIQYGQEPIYVVDNVIVDRAFDSLNPDDIASIDVLKDASATALYGSRGANGVIVVTTKKGSKGRNQVTYDVWFGSQSFTKEMPMLSTFDLRDLRIEAGVNAYMDANPGTDRETAEKIFSNPNVNRNPIFTKEDLETLADSTSYNWLDEVVRSGFQQNHSLAISGGSETGSYYIGLGYNKQIGQLVGSDYERLSGKINMEQQVKPWLRVGTNTTYTYADENPVGSDDIFPNSLRISPLTPISAEPVFLKRGKAIDHGLANPLRDKYISRQNYQTNFINSTFANIRLMEGLDLRSTGSINIIQREEYVYYPSVSAKASSEKDGYASAELRKSRWTNWQWDNTLSYNKTFAEVHRLGAIVGTNTSYYGENWNWLKAAGFQNDLFTFKKLDGATRLADSQLSSDFNSYSMMSYWARANYVYDSRYYLTATVRRDGSSRFGPENKWGTFPSVVGSWNVTGEEFMAGQTIFNNLRVR